MRNMTIFQPVSKTRHLLGAILLVCLACAVHAQTSAIKNTTSERNWPAFWRQLTVAIKKKDRAALLRIMPNDFSDGGGGLTAKEWLQFLDENERKGSWRDLQKSVAGGAKINRNWSAKGVPTKVTRDNGYYFEFRKDGKWYFAGVVGD